MSLVHGSPTDELQQSLSPYWHDSDAPLNSKAASSCSVTNQAELEPPGRICDAQGGPYGNIGHYPAHGLSVLPFREPDNLQLALIAPYS